LQRMPWLSRCKQAFSRSCQCLAKRQAGLASVVLICCRDEMLSCRLRQMCAPLARETHLRTGQLIDFHYTTPHSSEETTGNPGRAENYRDTYRNIYLQRMVPSVASKMRPFDRLEFSGRLRTYSRCLSACCWCAKR
jgi:hypothetical protein